jgi:hypothetical protein
MTAAAGAAGSMGGGNEALAARAVALFNDGYN